MFAALDFLTGQKQTQVDFCKYCSTVIFVNKDGGYFLD